MRRFWLEKDPSLVETAALRKVIHEALGGDGWGYSNIGGDELHGSEQELEAVARAVIEYFINDTRLLNKTKL